MTKVELIKEMAVNAGMTQVSAKEAYEGLEKAILNALANGEEEVKLGFATIKVQHQDERERRNPRTGDVFMAEAKNVAKIKLAQK